MPTRPTRTTLALLSLLPVLGGCLDPTGPRPDAAPEKIEALPRALSAFERQVVARSNDFGLTLLKEVHARESDSPNVFLSPLSASMALGMTLNGADGETFEAMRGTLGFGDLAQADINRSYRELTELLLGLDPRTELSIANSTWARQGFAFVPAFFETLRDWFDAEARELDFADPLAPREINDWACRKTRERICEVIEEIDPDHILFLLNALYFKGQWTHRFDGRETRPAPFRLGDGSVVQVPTMRGRPSVGVAWVDGVQIGELPYGGQAFVMNVVLPGQGETLEDLVARLDGDTWARWTGAIGGYQPLDVQLPRLELEYEKVLNDALEAMGMGVAFGDQADFTRITPARAKIDFVKQNTFLKVDEEGTEAAAVTTVGIGIVSAPPSLVVDRAFLLAIRERLSGTILFVGAMGDPRP